MRASLTKLAMATALAAGLAACTKTETVEVPVIVPGEIPACSAAYQGGLCPSGESCYQGACVATSTLCSASNTSGTCPGGWSCYEGGCIPAAVVPQACSATVPNGTCAAGSQCVQGTCLESATVCSATNQSGVCPASWTCYKGGCVVADPVPVDPCTLRVNTVQPTLSFASDLAETVATEGRISPEGKALGTAAAVYTYDDDANTATPAVEVPFTRKSAITVDGLRFRDLNANGTLEKYEDWRYSPICRAQDLAARMEVPEKVGLMGSNSNIGGGNTTGVLAQSVINVLFQQHRRQALIRISGTSPADYGRYMNNIQALVEGTRWGIPLVSSEDPSQHGTAIFSSWTTQMGIGAINDVDVSFAFGNATREDAMGIGIRQQLGPIVDTATEPRWYRFTHALGEEAEGVAKHGRQIILGYQNGPNGLAGGIAAVLKHFPGHGPQDNGQDSHAVQGKFAVYPGGMFEYHLKPFITGIEAGAVGVMPCYSIQQGILDYNPGQTGTSFAPGMVTRLLKQELGFDGMVTADWGILCAGGPGFICSPHGVDTLTPAERAALYIQAGGHQLGNDDISFIQAAYDQGLLQEADITHAAAKILEMSFKLGVFENPYTTPEMSARTNSELNERLGFESQQKAIVLLRNGSGAGRLPITDWRYTNVTTLPNGQPGTPNAPDVGEFTSDSDADGSIEVYFDSTVDALTGSDRYDNLFEGYDYRSAGAGTSGTVGFTLPIIDVGPAATAYTTADIVVYRITARNSAIGQDAEVPLSYDGLYLGTGTDGSRANGLRQAQRIMEFFRARDGFTRIDGTVVPPTNPNLRIVLIQRMDRPGIVKPFINGLRTLDERPGCSYTVGGAAALELCYPLVSDEANINPQIVTTTTATAHRGVDTFLVEFGSDDRALLDFIFNRNVPASPPGYQHGRARLPAEIPSTDDAVRGQFEDRAADSAQPTFLIGAGITLPTN